MRLKNKKTYEEEYLDRKKSTKKIIEKITSPGHRDCQEIYHKIVDGVKSEEELE